MRLRLPHPRWSPPPPPPPPPPPTTTVGTTTNGRHDYDGPASDHDLGTELRAKLPRLLHPPPLPDRNCGDIPYRNFCVIYTVLDRDPRGFDRDRDGIGCET
jgi:hypothetical protein